MEHPVKTLETGIQIELRLKELIQLILPLHALLEGSYDETTHRLEEVIDALAQIALALQQTVKALNAEPQQRSLALDLRLQTIMRNQDLQMQMLADLHDWLGVVPRPTVGHSS
jgi:hypothetical protein